MLELPNKNFCSRKMFSWYLGFYFKAQVFFIEWSIMTVMAILNKRYDSINHIIAYVIITQPTSYDVSIKLNSMKWLKNCYIWAYKWHHFFKGTQTFFKA